jgi:hypothetical protein
LLRLEAERLDPQVHLVPWHFVHVFRSVRLAIVAVGFAFQVVQQFADSWLFAPRGVGCVMSSSNRSNPEGGMGNPSHPGFTLPDLR